MSFNRLSRFLDDPSVLLSVQHKDLSMGNAKEKTNYNDETDGIDEMNRGILVKLTGNKLPP